MKASPYSRVKGFTLIELLITVALVGLIALAALPFTTSWVDSSVTQDTAANVRHLLAKAQAHALKNPLGRTTGEPTVAVCSDGADLWLDEGTPVISPFCDRAKDKATFITSLSGRAALTDGNNRFECLCLDNKARPISSGANCSLCSGAITFSVHVGEYSETISQ